MGNLFNKVLSRYGKYKAENPCLREGQALFAILYEENAELAKEITGSEIDPFYLDGRVEQFLNWLYER